MNSSELASYVIQDLFCVKTLFFRQTTQNSPKYGFPNQSLHSLIQNHIVTSSDDFSGHLILQAKTISKHFKVMPLPKPTCTKQFAEYEKGHGHFSKRQKTKALPGNLLINSLQRKPSSLMTYPIINSVY